LLVRYQALRGKTDIVHAVSPKFWLEFPALYRSAANAAVGTAGIQNFW
jgi:hypothetical protein